MLVPLEHVLLLAQILIGLRLIYSLKAWLGRLEQEAAARLGDYPSKPGSRQWVNGTINGAGGAADTESISIGDESARNDINELDMAGHPGPAHEWRTRPVMLRIASGVQEGQQVEFNHPDSVFDVETELFVGKMYFRLRGCANEPKDYFFGKQRRLSAVVQGRFKQPLVMGECYTGYEFMKPFQNVPAPFLIRAGLHFIRTLAPTLIEDILGEHPYFLNPLCQTIQVRPPRTRPACAERARGGARRESARAGGERRGVTQSAPRGLVGVAFWRGREAKSACGLLLAHPAICLPPPRACALRAQVLHVAEPGSEPPITEVLVENNAKLGGIFSERKVDRIKRKNYFAHESNGARARATPAADGVRVRAHRALRGTRRAARRRFSRAGAKHSFDPDLVYTMEFYEDKFDPAYFDLMLIGLRCAARRALAPPHCRAGRSALTRTACACAAPAAHHAASICTASSAASPCRSWGSTGARRTRATTSSTWRCGTSHSSARGHRSAPRRSCACELSRGVSLRRGSCGVPLRRSTRGSGTSLPRVAAAA